MLVKNHMLAQVREKFWIPKGRSAVRKIVRSCLTCKKQRARTMEQMMATLPGFRTTSYEPCFTHSGVDYFGPLNVKMGRAVVKRWGVIFTCLNSRAVHLELASSLESSCFINVLRRFVNRTGPPKFIHADNGTNFVGAENPSKIGSRSKFKTAYYRRDVNGFSNHPRPHMPVESGKG